MKKLPWWLLALLFVGVKLLDVMPSLSLLAGMAALLAVIPAWLIVSAVIRRFGKQRAR